LTAKALSGFLHPVPQIEAILAPAPFPPVIAHNRPLSIS
jgi:hypothetical protein